MITLSRRILFWLASAVSFVVAVVLLFSALDHIGISNPHDWWYGIDFVPAIWIAVPGFLLGVVWLLFRKWRLAWVWLTAVLVFFLSFGDVSGGPVVRQFSQTEKAVRSVSVAALNVEYYAEGIREVMKGIREMNCDVVLLSENNLDSTNASIIAEMMPDYTLRSGHKNSTAVLSSLPIAEYREVQLHSYEASLSGGNDIAQQSQHPHRSFVHVVAQLEGKDINLIAIRLIAGRPKNHSLEENLRWGRYLLDAQQAEARAFAEYVKNLSGPIIFGGDLNAPPRSRTMRVFDAIGQDAYLSDHFWGDLTFRTSFPTLRLDYLFGMNGAIPFRSRVVPLIVSDHFPVMAEFSLPGSDVVQH